MSLLLFNRKRMEERRKGHFLRNIIDVLYKSLIFNFQLFLEFNKASRKSLKNIQH